MVFVLEIVRLLFLFVRTFHIIVLGGHFMRVITATELKQNLGKYIELSKEEDVIIKKNGKIVTVLTSPSEREKDTASFLSLMGKYEYFDYEAYLRERDEQR